MYASCLLKGTKVMGITSMVLYMGITRRILMNPTGIVPLMCIVHRPRLGRHWEHMDPDIFILSTLRAGFILTYSAIIHFKKINTKIFRFIIFNVLIILLSILKTNII